MPDPTAVFTRAETHLTPHDLPEAVTAVRQAALDMKYAADAVEATEGKDRALLDLLERRVEALGELAWGIEGGTGGGGRSALEDAWEPFVRGEAGTRGGLCLFALPVLQVATEALALMDPHEEIPGTSRWLCCRMLASMIAGAFLAWAAKHERQEEAINA